jgi:hypothetical protein
VEHVKKYLLIFKVHGQGDGFSGEVSAERAVECLPSALPELIQERKESLEMHARRVGRNNDATISVILTQVVPLE